MTFVAARKLEHSQQRDRQRSADADRIALVDHLWRLKKQWQDHTGTHVPLNILIKETEYRHDVLKGAVNSGKPELQALAARIRSIEAGLPQGTISSLGGNNDDATPRALWFALAFALTSMILLAGYISWDVFGRDSGEYVMQLPVVDPRIEFRLHGSNTVGEELAPALLTAWYETRNALETVVAANDVGVERQVQAVLASNPRDAMAIEVHAHGSSTGFRSLENRTADMAMSSRPIKPAEIETLGAMYGDMSTVSSEYVLALDGLAVIVHPSNPLESLNKQDVARIFSGEVTDWAQLGGNPGRISLYARDDNSGTFDTFKSLVLKPQQRALSSTARRYESSTELSDAVSADGNAIGFIGLPYVRSARALGISESADTRAIVPTEFTVGTEDYPLSRRLFFYVPGNTDNRNIRDFVEFSLSDAGQAVVERVGLVSQRIVAVRPQPREDAPTEYLRTVSNAQRLSASFRFIPGTARLDNKSVRDINRVVDFMRANRDREILLLGFTDDPGSPTENRAESLQSARNVADYLVARGLYPSVVEGFGDALPVASNTTEAGRNRNRRVEIWIR